MSKNKIKRIKRLIVEFCNRYDKPILLTRGEIAAPVKSTKFPSLRFHLRTLLAAMLGLNFLVICESAADEPAVSALNAKLGAQGGSLDGMATGIGFGSFTTPLGHSFGVQVDAGAGSVDSKTYWSTGAHLFWRAPSVGLLGLTYSYQSWNDFYSEAVK